MVTSISPDPLTMMIFLAPELQSLLAVIAQALVVNREVQSSAIRAGLFTQRARADQLRIVVCARGNPSSSGLHDSWKPDCRPRGPSVR
jgi:hypothetical protein